MEEMDGRIEVLEESGVGSTKSVLNVLDTSNTLSGKTVTVSIVGGETLTETIHNGSAQFHLSYIGNYTITCDSLSQVIANEMLGSVHNVDIQPSWVVWCHEGNVDDSSYENLDELLEDEVAIRKLMTIHASVDYLAEVCIDTTFLTKIINNDLCAKWINLRDYALDTLYASERVSPLMDEADKYFYGEWALMPQVPTMTSNTAPYGEAFASSERVAAGYDHEAYKVFNRVIEYTGVSEANKWAGTSKVNEYVGYTFNVGIVVKRVELVEDINSSYGAMAKDILIQGSNDMSTWTTLAEFTVPNETTAMMHIIDIENETAYTSYRIYVKNMYVEGSDYTISLRHLQFYAWQPKGNVPVMTSNTTPYGEASASSTHSNYPAYYAFCGNQNTRTVENDGAYWCSTQNDSSGWLQYKFTNPIKLSAIKYCIPIGGGTEPTYNSTAIIQISNDGSVWTNLKNIDLSADEHNIDHFIKVDNNEYSLYIRIYINSKMYSYSSSTGSVWLARVQFYGRELKVSVPNMTSDTEPYGEVTVSKVYYEPGSSQYQYGWKAFNADLSNLNAWNANNTTSDVEEWIQYRFTGPKCIKMMRLITTSKTTSNSIDRVGTLYGSNDGETWASINNFTFQEAGTTAQLTFTRSLDNDESYSYYRWKQNCNGRGSSAWYATILSLQFYGLDYSEYDWDQDNPRHYIYDHGVELEELETGTALVSGWTGVAPIKEPDEIRCRTGQSSNATSSVITKTPIDLSSYTYIFARIVQGRSFDTTYNSYIGIRISTGNVNTNNSDISDESCVSPNFKRILCMNVVNINQVVYIAVQNVRLADASFAELWLE